jgi:hypothetical protein
MSDPTRMTDPRSSSPESFRRLVRAGRSELPDEARLRSLGNRLGFGAGATPVGIAAGKSALGLLGASGGKIGAAIVIVATASAALATLKPSTNRPPAAASPSEPPRPTVETTGQGADLQTRELAPALDSATYQEVPSMPSAPTPRPPPRAAPARPTSGEPQFATPAPQATLPPSPVPTPPTETEFSLLEQAQRALSDDPQRALALADRDGRLYPAGSLAQEREVIAIEALMKLGRSDEARLRADRFSRTFPGSAHTPRVMQLVDPARDFHNF